MRARSLALLGLTLALTCASACVSRFADFHVRQITAVQVHDIDEHGFAMTVNARVENPNRLAAQVRDIRFRASTGAYLLGTGEVARPVTAPARSSFPLAATVWVPFAQLPADFPARIADGALPLIVDASFSADTRIGQFDMQLRTEGRTAIDRDLAVVISGALRSSAVRVTEITQLGFELTGVRLQVRVTLRNAFPFPLRIERGDIGFLLGGLRVGSTRIERAIDLPARGQVAGEFTVRVSHTDMLRVAAAVSAGDVATRAAGTLWIAPIGGIERIPFDVATDLSVIEGL